MVSGFTPVVLLFFPMIPVNSHQQGAVVIGGAQHFDREIITVGKNQVQFRVAHSRVTVDRQVGGTVSAVGTAMIDLDVRQLDQRVVQCAGNLAGSAAGR